MTTYKTYQEAKIANPENDIYVSMSGDFSTDYYVANLELSGCKQGWNLCDPRDYCMTVEEFLSEGYRFEIGDLIVDITRKAYNIITSSISIWNQPSSNDSSRYILKAKALEEKIPKDVDKNNNVVEWNNGDKCIYNGKEWQFVSILSEDFHGTAVIFDETTEDLMQVSFSTISKPETQQQREKRILEELADEACENLFGDSIQNCRTDVAETVRWMINHGYRKQD